eukprot:2373183-Rhodomonas_salina.1
MANLNAAGSGSVEDSPSRSQTRRQPTGVALILCPQAGSFELGPLALWQWHISAQTELRVLCPGIPARGEIPVTQLAREGPVYPGTRVPGTARQNGGQPMPVTLAASGFLLRLGPP